MSIKYSNDTIGNRIRGLPACSAVPRPSAPLRVPLMRVRERKMCWLVLIFYKMCLPVVMMYTVDCDQGNWTVFLFRFFIYCWENCSSCIDSRSNYQEPHYMLHVCIFSRTIHQNSYMFRSFFLDHLQGISLSELFINALTWMTLILIKSRDFSSLRNVHPSVAAHPVCSTPSLQHTQSPVLLEPSKFPRR